MEFVCISIFFSQIIKSALIKKLILYIIIPFAILSIWDFVKSDSGVFNFIPLVVECFFFLLYILYFFYEKMRSTSTIPAYQTTSFWIAVAFTLYCSGNFFLFLYAKNSMQNENFKIQYNLIYSTFTILKNIFLCIGISIKEIDNSKSNIQTIADDVWEIPAEYKKPKP